MVVISAQKLNKLVSGYGKVCRKRKLKINVEKSKVMRCSTSKGLELLNVRLNAEKFGKVKRAQG